MSEIDRKRIGPGTARSRARRSASPEEVRVARRGRVRPTLAQGDCRVVPFVGGFRANRQRPVVAYVRDQPLAGPGIVPIHGLSSVVVGEVTTNGRSLHRVRRISRRTRQSRR
jgi:hypothetical protein